MGVHRGTDKALGRLANRSLREWKKRAHYDFDPISRTPLINRIWPKYIPGISNRNKAYRWLAAQMGIEPEVCHIGMFDEFQCECVVAICKSALVKAGVEL